MNFTENRHFFSGLPVHGFRGFHAQPQRTINLQVTIPNLNGIDSTDTRIVQLRGKEVKLNSVYVPEFLRSLEL